MSYSKKAKQCYPVFYNIQQDGLAMDIEQIGVKQSVRRISSHAVQSACTVYPANFLSYFTKVGEYRCQQELCKQKQK